MIPSAWMGDVIVLVHFFFVAFVVTGGVLVWRWPRLAWLHLPAVAWGAAVEIFGWACPLTELEVRYGALAGQGVGGEDFIARLLVPLIYPGWLTRETQIAIGFGVLLVNAVIYATILRRKLKVGRAGSR